MPIKVPDNLPALETLHAEQVDVFHEIGSASGYPPDRVAIAQSDTKKT